MAETETTPTAAAEERVSSPNGGRYGSIGSAANDSPPKPAVRQRTSTARQAAGDSQKAQGLCDGQSRKGSLSARDELNRELQAELGRKLSLARSRLEQSEQLEHQVKVSTANNQDHHQQQQQQQQQQKQPTAATDLSLSLSLSAMEKPHNQKARRRQDEDQQSSSLSIGAYSPPSRAYPKQVFFIIANEFCERFSYYGLRTVLVMYLTRVLNFSESNSTITFHLFAMLCYVTPILGAILGDSILGKFKTILYLSIVYFFGELILVLSSVFWNYGQLSVWSTFGGLFLIGLGTGGIKPCVSALGGDQFQAHEDKWRQSFFSIFYAAINLGSLISMFVSPFLRTEFACVGRQDCFPHAFGLPCALMLLSIVVFLLAKNHYHLAPLPEQNVIVSFCNCTLLALKRKLTGKRPKFVLDDNLAIIKGANQDSASSSSGSEISSSNEFTLVSSSAQSSNTHLAPGGGPTKVAHLQTDDSRRRSHWLYLAADRFDSKSIEAFRSVLGVLLLFIPTLVYWCLFDQQGSLWTLQATRMDGHIFGTNFVLQPDQMGVANPLILLLVIPVFEVIIYPTLGRCNLMRRPLQRMTAGGFVASLAFLSAAAIELRIQQFLPPNEPQLGSANLILVNGLRECSVIKPTISYITTPDALLLASNHPLVSVATNQTALLLEDASSAEQQQVGGQATISLSSLEAFDVRSVEVRSANLSALANYELTLRLADSPEQIKSNRSFGCPIADPNLEHEFRLAPMPDRATRLLYLELGNGKLTHKVFNESLELPPSNKARVRLLYEFFGSSSQAEKRQFSLTSISGSKSTNNSSSRADFRKSFTNSLRDGQVLLSDYLDIEVPTNGGKFHLEATGTKLTWTAAAAGDPSAGVLELEPGTRNLLIVHQSDANHVWLKHQVLQDNKYRVNMLYQLIPYTLISMSEVMFSITGLEFSYAMAPASMKSVLLAIWSLTIAFGNLLTVFVESLHMFSNVAHEFIFYAGLMAADMCIFAIMGYNFRPNKYHGQ